MKTLLLPLGFALLLAPAFFGTVEQDALRTISKRVWHLGNDPTPEWTEAPEQPEEPSQPEGPAAPEKPGA